jgi:ketosteroid isomerase-like protein
VGHPNEQVIRDWTRAVSNRDLDAARSLLHENAVFHFGGRNPVADDYVGRDHVLNDLFRRLTHVFDRLDVDLHDVVGNDDHVVALIDQTAYRGSRSLRTRTVGVYHVQYGRIAEAWIVEGDQHALDEFIAD